jgi:two-component system, LytTR family, response regulator LytT
MNVFIIEDEQLGAQRLVKLLREIDSSIEIQGMADSVKSSVKWLQSNPAPDLVFMDIELADGQSFAICRQVHISCPIIFTTSFDEYALEAFKVNSIDYLLKPIKKEELQRSLEKYRQVQQHYAGNQLAQIAGLLSDLKQRTQGFRQRFLVKQGQRLVSVDVTEIAYFYIDGRLCFFRTWDGAKFVIDYTLEELGPMLDPALFRRINRSFIVHIRAVANIHTYFTGKLKLDLKPATDKEVTISKENVSAFKAFMGQ